MLKNFRDTWELLNAYERARFTRLTLAGMLVSIADIAALALLVISIKNYISSHAVNLPWLTQNDPLILFGLFVMIFALKNLLAYQLNYRQDQFYSSVALRLSENTFKKFQEMEYLDHVNTDSGKLIREVTLEPFEFSQQVVGGWQQLINQSILVLLSVAAVLFFNATLFLLVCMVLFPPGWLVFRHLRNRIARVKTEVRMHNERSYRYLLDASEGYVEARLHDRKEFFRQRFMNERSKFSRRLFHSLSLQQFPPRIIEVFAILGLFSLFAFLRWTEPGNKDILLTTAAFLAAAYKIIPGISKIINLASQVRSFSFSGFAQTKTFAGRMHALTNGGSRSIQSIGIEALQFGYRERRIFDGFTLHAEKTELVGIEGSSGIGKTTLLHILLGLIPPEEGSIRINGKSIRPAHLHQYWPQISYVKQGTFLFSGTIEQNITMESTVSSPGKLEQVMRVTGLQELKTSMDHMVAEKGRNLSGGQRQRIGLARALYKNAGLLILDEAFNELDMHSSLQILKNIRSEYGKEMILLMVTHEQTLLQTCDRVITIYEPA